MKKEIIVEYEDLGFAHVIGKTRQELIRCRDCKHYDFWGDSMICMRRGSYYGDTNPDDFCSKAERKE